MSYTYTKTLETLSRDIRIWLDANAMTNNGWLDEQVEKNLNNIKSTGYHFLHGSGDFTNKPLNENQGSCMLIIFKDNVQITCQVFINLDTANTYFRYKYNTAPLGYGDWIALSNSNSNNTVDSEELVAQINSILNQIKNGTAISDQTDLNNIQTTGIYWLSTNCTYINSPVKSGVLLVYMDTTNEITLATRKYQLIIDYSTQTIYTRNCKLKKFSNLDEVISIEDSSIEISWSDWNNLGELTPLALGELKADLNAMSQTEFLVPLAGNIFDNNFIEGYRIAGPANITDDDLNNDEITDNSRYTFGIANGYKGTAIVPVKPNTSYWIGLDQIIHERRPILEAPDDEKEYSYFALATAVSALKPGDNFNGDIFRKMPTVDIIGHIITTGPNDKYLYVQTCRGEYEEPPYLEIIQIDLNNMPAQLDAATKIPYLSKNKKDNDNGCYILLPSNGWTPLTNRGDYGKVIYGFSDKINLSQDKNIVDLNNKINTAITNNLSVNIQGNTSNLFDGNFISYTKGYRVGGSTISNMASNVNGTNNNPIAVIPVSIGKKYHLYMSPRGKECSSNNNGTITYSYFTKVGASDLTKNEIERKADRGETIPLGHVGTFTSSNSIITDLYLTIQEQYYIGNNANSGSIIPKTLIIQTTGDQNVPLIYMEEIEEFPEGLTTLSQYISYNKIPNIIPPINSYGEITINYGRINYKLKHEYNPKKGTNTWRWWRHGVDEGIFFDGTDCEGPIRLSNIEEDGTFTNQSDYIGGYHGNELMESVSLLINGQKVALNSQQNFDNCKTVSMIVESNCYYSHKHLYEVSSIVNNNDGTLTIVYLDGDVNAPEGGGPVNVTINQTQINIGDAQLKTIIGYSTKYLILNYAREDCLFHRIKHLSFENNKLNIRNYWKYVGPNNKYALNHGFYTGLYSILFKYLNGVSSNYTNRLFTIPLENETDKSNKDLISAEASKYLTEVKFFGKSFNTTIKSLKGQSEYYQGRISNMLPSSGARYKAYLSDYELGKNTIKLTKNNEFIGEFEIETKAPDSYYLFQDGTVANI